MRACIGCGPFLASVCDALQTVTKHREEIVEREAERIERTWFQGLEAFSRARVPPAGPQAAGRVVRKVPGRGRVLVSTPIRRRADAAQCVVDAAIPRWRRRQYHNASGRLNGLRTREPSDPCRSGGRLSSASQPGSAQSLGSNRVEQSGRCHVVHSMRVTPESNGVWRRLLSTSRLS